MEKESELKTSSDLRKFMLKAIVDVRYGHLSIDKARAIVELVDQVNVGLRTEIQAWSLLSSLGNAKEDQKFGGLPLTLDSM